MRVFTNLAEFERWRRSAAGVALVPTMGALHEGHVSLVRQAASLARARGTSWGTVVTIFVNPTQFNDPADYQRYPKTLDADVAACEAAGATAVLAPAPEEVYPPGMEIGTPELPEVAMTPGLEDAHRHGHFAGVCQVVKRLFELTTPAAAVFGEKDWQQLQVVSAMTAALRMAVEIVPGATVRDPDGLAMSSRNRFLSPEDRARGLALSRGLHAAGVEGTPDGAEAALRKVLGAAGITPDYAVVREAESLMPRRELAGKPGVRWRAVVAAKVGSVRLLDNMAWPAR